MGQYQELSEAIIKGYAAKAKEHTEALLDTGATAQDILHQGLVPGMDVVGEKFRKNEYYIPNVLLSAKAMNHAMEILKPLIARGDVEFIGKAIICTVQGDLHDIGKNMVKMMMEGAGFEMVDLGVDVSADLIVQAVREHKPNFVMLSALLSTTMPGMRTVVSALREANCRDGVKVLIGGAPVTQQFADEIGADGYAPDASSATIKARELRSA
jgi:5-methyltetrahydrofolate--homocysteine methyltransferase